MRAVAASGGARQARAAFLSCLAGILLWGALPLAALAANYRLEVQAPDELLEAIHTRTLLGRWVEEENFEREQLPLFIERGREEVFAVARDHGYFRAQVSVDAEDVAPVQGVAPANVERVPVVRIVVHAGPRTTVGQFAFDLQGPPAAQQMQAQLRSQWPLPEGSFFQPSLWEQGKRLLVELLNQKGFLHAKVSDSEAEVDVVRTAARLRLTVESGPQMRYGPLEVRGLSRYHRRNVVALRPWREQSADEPGDPYDFDEVLRYQTRLRTAGWFSGADVMPDLDAIRVDPDRLDVPMIVALRERRRQRVHGGVGYSTDEGFRGLLGYEHRDVLGRGLLLDSGLLLQSVNRRAYATIRTPQRASGNYEQLGARFDRMDLHGELTRRRTLFVGQGWRGTEVDYLVSLQYQTEDRVVPLNPVTDHRKALTLGLAWNLRRVDNLLDPRRGYTVSLQASGASRSVGSDANFVRLWGRAMKFWPMPRDTVFEGGLLVGLVQVGEVFSSSREGIPTENLFRTGGTNTVRGYRYQSLGVYEEGAIVGGRVTAVASLEYQHPVRKDWYAAAFMDVGNAADTWSSWKAVRGYGVGARWRSPLGPMALDLAWGEADRKFRVHLSVGYAF